MSRVPSVKSNVFAICTKHWARQSTLSDTTQSAGMYRYALMGCKHRIVSIVTMDGSPIMKPDPSAMLKPNYWWETYDTASDLMESAA